jgi:TusA-related sulfurtransferase
MTTKTELDLVGVLSPVCLLKCKSVLTEMDSGNVLEVLLKDTDVVEQLVKIIKRSQDQVIKLEMEGDHYRISLKKGERE